eukprot:7763115-Pyramimonas_sp.AAC.2
MSRYDDGRASMCGECLCAMSAAMADAGAPVADTAALAACGEKAKPMLAQVRCDPIKREEGAYSNTVIQ